MKKLFTLLVLIMVGGQSFSQVVGKKFINGSFNLLAANDRLKNLDWNNNALGLGADIALGTFHTEEHVSGWLVGASISARSDSWSKDVYPWGDQGNGIGHFSFNGGKFWQFYRHITSHWGLYGQHDVRFDFSNTKQFQNETVAEYSRSISQEYRIGFNLSAGTYYRLSDKWWFTASLAMSSPLYLGMTHKKSDYYNSSGEISHTSKNNTLTYQLAPTLRLPSVNLGITYFFK